MKEYINEALEKYIEKGTYPWHMPGHKRQPIEAVQNVDNISKSRENFWNGPGADDFADFFFEHFKRLYFKHSI